MEADFLSLLKKLLAYCESYTSLSVSNLDPMAHIFKQSEHIADSLRYLIVSYSQLQSQYPVSEYYTDALIESLNTEMVIESYSKILLTGVNLIFDYNETNFRSVHNPIFIQSILKIYLHLQEYVIYYGEQISHRLQDCINEFKYQITSKYMEANNNIMKFNQTIDLLSFTNDIVASTSIKNTNIIEREYFKLSLPRFNFNNILVEICVLENKQFAIFKVNNGELIPSSEDILDKLLQNNFSYLKLGKTLLFPVIRSTDLRIVKTSINSITFETKSGNGIQMEIKCNNLEHWESYWKVFFNHYFQYTTPSIYQNNTNSYQIDVQANNFNEKVKKLNALKANTSSQGIGFSMQSKTKISESIPGIYQQPSNTKSASSLHRSQPLQTSFTSLLSNELNISSPKSTKSSDSLESSLESIQTMSYEKLLELDKSIDVMLSPVIKIPKIKTIRNVSHVPSLNKNEGQCVTANIAEEIEDMISVDSYDINDIRKNCLNNNQSNIDVNKKDINEDIILLSNSQSSKLQFYSKQKASSLLSFFSSNKNKKKLTINTPTFEIHNHSPNSSSSSFFKTGSSMNDSSLQANLSIPNDDSFAPELSDKYNLDENISLLSIENVQLATWDKNTWSKSDDNLLNLNIISTFEKEKVLLLSIPDKNLHPRVRLAISLNSKCKVLRSSAKDIQIKCPHSNIIINTMQKLEYYTFNIRCHNTETLFTSFNSSITLSKKDTKSHTLSNSHTINTLSTTASSYFSNISSNTKVTENFTDINSNEFSSTDTNVKLFNSTCLIDSIKVKHHSFNNQNMMWEFKSVVDISIYSQEYQKERVALKFELKENTDFMNRTKKNNKLFISYLEDVAKLGRTGLSLNDFATGQNELFEFQNKSIADDVYNTII